MALSFSYLMYIYILCLKDLLLVSRRFMNRNLSTFKSSKSDNQYCFEYISAPTYCTEMVLYLKCTYECHL